MFFAQRMKQYVWLIRYFKRLKTLIVHIPLNVYLLVSSQLRFFLNWLSRKSCSHKLIPFCYHFAVEFLPRYY